MLPPFQLEQTIAKLVREDWGRILATLVSNFKDWQLAEDVLQDSVEQAIVLWQQDGLPDSPAAWLLTTARRKALDHYRRNTRFAQLQEEIAYLTETQQPNEQLDLDTVIPDKRLELIFTCCHPALERKTQVALTLRTLGGLSTEEIATAYLDKTQTMAQRLARAKKKIAAAKIPFEIPDEKRLNERLSAVLSVIYLIFNEGYAASSGSHITRTDLSDEAVRLARIVKQLMPSQTEVSGLLALMLLHDSRRSTRQNNHNEMISLEDQNRLLWDKGKIQEGVALLKSTLKKQQIGPYQLQAAISAIHAESSSWDATDWPQIAALYQLLYTSSPSNVVRINQAVAISYADSVQSGLDILNEVEQESKLNAYQPFYAARADLNSRANNKDAAIADFEMAIKLSDNKPQISFLKKRLIALSK